MSAAKGIAKSTAYLPPTSGVKERGVIPRGFSTELSLACDKWLISRGLDPKFDWRNNALKYGKAK